MFFLSFWCFGRGWGFCEGFRVVGPAFWALPWLRVKRRRVSEWLCQDAIWFPSVVSWVILGVLLRGLLAFVVLGSGERRGERTQIKNVILQEWAVQNIVQFGAMWHLGPIFLVCFLCCFFSKCFISDCFHVIFITSMKQLLHHLMIAQTDVK